MRKATAGKALLRALEDFVAACAPAHEPNDWLDQVSSPLGRRRHLALARRGLLPSVKDGKRILVRRSDMDAYLATHGASRARRSDLNDSPEDSRSHDVAASVLAALGFELKAG